MNAKIIVCLISKLLLAAVKYIAIIQVPDQISLILGIYL